MKIKIKWKCETGKYTPEAACEHPGAVRQLALEFARAGGDVTQTFTYGSTEGNPHLIKILSLDQKPSFIHFSLGMLEGCRFTPEQINQAACDIAKQVLGPCTPWSFFAVHGFPMICKQCMHIFFSKVAKENGTMVAGGITQTKAYTYQEVAWVFTKSSNFAQILSFSYSWLNWWDIQNKKDS